MMLRRCLVLPLVANAFVMTPPMTTNGPLKALADVEAWGVSVSEGVYRFDVKDQGYAVDIVGCTIVKDGGLGLVLEEIAANDEAGVVVVKDVVPDSPAALSPLKPGDVLSKVNGRNVEAKNYDDLVAILVNEDAVLDIEAKRLRKRFQVQATIEYANDEKPLMETTLFADENLRKALIARGVKVNDAQLGRSCGGDGACETCAVVVVNDGALTEPKPVENIIFKDQNAPDSSHDGTWRLACQTSIQDARGSASDEHLKLRIYPHREK